MKPEPKFVVKNKATDRKFKIFHGHFILFFNLQEAFTSAQRRMNLRKTPEAYTSLDI